MDDTDQGLARRYAVQHFLAERLFFDLRDEIFYYRQCNICFQECNTHFAQRVLHVGFREPRLTAQGFDDGSQPVGKIVEHGSVLVISVGVDCK